MIDEPAQLSLDDYATSPAARPSDPVTSHEAAARPGRATGKLRVLRALRRHGPMHDEAIAEATGLEKGVAAKRRLDLVKAGYAQPHVREGEHFTTLTRSGSRALVWEVSALGNTVPLPPE